MAGYVAIYSYVQQLTGVAYWVTEQLGVYRYVPGSCLPVSNSLYIINMVTLRLGCANVTGINWHCDQAIPSGLYS